MQLFKLLCLSLFVSAMCCTTGCKTDQCATVTCQNGGVCATGICTCINGYYGTNCEKKELCRISKFKTKDGANPEVAMTVTFDAQNRFVQRSGPGENLTVTYGTGELTAITTYTGTNYSNERVLLNAKGNPTAVYAVYNFGSGITRDTISWVYDASGVLAQTQISGNELVTFSNVNGNRITAIATNRTSGATIYTKTYEYFTDRTMPNSYYTFDPYTWTGVYHKNPIKKINVTYADGRTRVVDYTYDYNPKGDITKETNVTTNTYTSGSTDTNTFIYTFEIACIQP